MLKCERFHFYINLIYLRQFQQQICVWFFVFQRNTSKFSILHHDIDNQGFEQVSLESHKIDIQIMDKWSKTLCSAFCLFE